MGFIKTNYEIEESGIMLDSAYAQINHLSINIDGTDISRASLSNLSIMKQTLGNKPFKGQIIEVSKRNQIIPKIERAKDEHGQWITI